MERTVSNITARNPRGEVVDLDGVKDGVEDLFSAKLMKWWGESKQAALTRSSARAMEIYGITIEKPSWDRETSEPKILTTDPFSFVPAPGNWKDLSKQAPYICYVYLKFKDEMERKFDVKGIATDEAYELLGAEREKYKQSETRRATMGNYADPMSRVGEADRTQSDEIVDRCVIIEVWIHDYSTKTVINDEPVLDATGQPVFDGEGGVITQKVKRTVSVYPDNVRKVTIAQRGGTSSDKAPGDRSAYLILDDCVNPNINPEADPENIKKTYPWGRLPVYTATSYEDLMSIWGFAASEQVGDLVLKINLIVSKLLSYVLNVMTPPLIVQRYCGISREMIESELNKGGQLVLMPYTHDARIEFMEIPNLPATFFNVLDLIIKLFDRVSQIEDVDRGEAPNRVVAASAIVALQERNDTLRQTKIRSIEGQIEERSRWAIGLWQNHSTTEEMVEVGGEPQTFIGVDHSKRRFSFLVEAGSTTPRTSLQTQELALKLKEMGVIESRDVLEALNFENWKEIVRRADATLFDQIIEILLDMGLKEDKAVELRGTLEALQKELASEQNLQSRTESRGKVSGQRPVSPGIPRATQGQNPPAGVNPSV